MKMKLDGYDEYKRREFCKDVKCPVQIELNKLAEASPAYELINAKIESGTVPRREYHEVDIMNLRRVPAQ